MLLPMLASADDRGKCGTNVNYTYDQSTHTLTISGSGAMTDYAEGVTPWDSYKQKIFNLVIGNGVTSIGEGAFYLGIVV